MKFIVQLVTTALLMAPGIALACPNISGNYTCTAYNGLIVLEIPVTQSADKSGVTTYVLDGAPVIADGQTHQAEKVPAILAKYVKDVKYKASCKAETVIFNGNGKLVKSGEPAKVDGVLKKTGKTTLKIDMVLDSSSGKRPVDADCAKN